MKIRRCGEQLQAWSKSSFGDVKKNIEKDRQKLNLLQNLDPTYIKKEDYDAAGVEMNKWKRISGWRGMK